MTIVLSSLWQELSQRDRQGERTFRTGSTKQGHHSYPLGGMDPCLRVVQGGYSTKKILHRSQGRYRRVVLLLARWLVFSCVDVISFGTRTD